MWIRDLTIEELTEEAMALLSLELNELYVVLGWQVTAASRPARVAHIMSHFGGLGELRQAESAGLDSSLDLRLSDWEKGLESIRGDLRREGILFFTSVKEDLRTGLCNEDVLSLSDEINRSTMQIIVMIIGAVLKIPAQIESISATLAAVVCKSGVRDLCGNR